MIYFGTEEISTTKTNLQAIRSRLQAGTKRPSNERKVLRFGRKSTTVLQKIRLFVYMKRKGNLRTGNDVLLFKGRFSFTQNERRDLRSTTGLYSSFWNVLAMLVWFWSIYSGLIKSAKFCSEGFHFVKVVGTEVGKESVCTSHSGQFGLQQSIGW